MAKRENRRSFLRYNCGLDRYWEKYEPRLLDKRDNGFYTVGEWISFYLSNHQPTPLKPINLSRRSHLPSQRIYDYISGKRGINASVSLALERGLEMDKSIRNKKAPGFFYRMQTLHEIFMFLFPRIRPIDPETRQPKPYPIITNDKDERPSIDVKDRRVNGFYTAGEWISFYLRVNKLKPINLSQKTKIKHQRIYDFINNKRRLSVKDSIKMEKALDMKYKNPGFFYKMQAMHDIFMLLHPKSRPIDPVTNNLKPYTIHIKKDKLAKFTCLDMF